MSVQTVAAGALGLCLLEVVLSSSAASDRLAGAGAGAAGVLNRIVSPYVPLIGGTAPTTPIASPKAATTAAATTPAATTQSTPFTGVVA